MSLIHSLFSDKKGLTRIKTVNDDFDEVILLKYEVGLRHKWIWSQGRLF